MKRPFLRSLLLILALVALPLRGMAAVAMCHCLQDRGDAVSVSVDQHAMHDESGTGNAGDSGHRAAPHDDPADGHVSHAASTCSGCAACCAGGALTPAATACLPFAPVGASRIPFSEQRMAVVVPAQLERPPLLQPL